MVVLDDVVVGHNLRVLWQVQVALHPLPDDVVVPLERLLPFATCPREEEGVEKIDQFFPVLVAVLRCIEPWVIDQIGSSHGTAERRPIPVLAHGKSYPTAVATLVVVP